jgi:hypothetical protein
MLQFKPRSAAAALIVTVALPASAGAAPSPAQDLRNPDRRAPVVVNDVPAQDLRNPDNRTYQPQVPGQDLRNPDRRAPVTGSEVITKIPAPAPVASDGFDWTDAGIGAAGGLAVISLAGGLAMAMAHRRRGARVPA